MLSILGPVLVGVFVLMLVLAKPTDSEPARFLTTWALGQVYALTALASAVSGITMILSNWM